MHESPHLRVHLRGGLFKVKLFRMKSSLVKSSSEILYLHKLVPLRGFACAFTNGLAGGDIDIDLKGRLSMWGDVWLNRSANLNSATTRLVRVRFVIPSMSCQPAPSNSPSSSPSSPLSDVRSLSAFISQDGDEGNQRHQPADMGRDALSNIGP